MLTRDAQKFDEFLRSSDAAAHEAIRVSNQIFLHGCLYVQRVHIAFCAETHACGFAVCYSFSTPVQYLCKACLIIDCRLCFYFENVQKADEAARVSQEKATAVRQLRQKLDATKARAASNREKVKEYSRYRAFLTHITPQVCRRQYISKPSLVRALPLRGCRKLSLTAVKAC